MNKPAVPNIVRFFLKGIFLVIYLFLNASCGSKEDCSGCYKDTPWSTSSSSYCYPDEDSCNEAEEEPCVKCTK